MLGKLCLWTQFNLLLHSNDLLNTIKFLWLSLTVISQVPPVGPGIKINGVKKKIKYGHYSVHQFTTRAQVVSCLNTLLKGEIQKANTQYLLHMDRKCRHANLHVLLFA